MEAEYNEKLVTHRSVQNMMNKVEDQRQTNGISSSKADENLHPSQTIENTTIFDKSRCLYEYIYYTNNWRSRFHKMRRTEIIVENKSIELHGERCFSNICSTLTAACTVVDYVTLHNFKNIEQTHSP